MFKNIPLILSSLFLSGVFSSVPESLCSFQSACDLLVGLLGSFARPLLQDAFLEMIRNERPALGCELATAAEEAPSPPVGLATSDDAAVFTCGGCDADAHTAASLSCRR